MSTPAYCTTGTVDIVLLLLPAHVLLADPQRRGWVWLVAELPGSIPGQSASAAGRIRGQLRAAGHTPRAAHPAGRGSRKREAAAVTVQGRTTAHHRRGGRQPHGRGERDLVINFASNNYAAGPQTRGAVPNRMSGLMARAAWQLLVLLASAGESESLKGSSVGWECVQICKTLFLCGLVLTSVSTLTCTQQFVFISGLLCRG